MNAGTYRSDIDAFIKATDWEVDSPIARRNMDTVLQWFCRNVDLHPAELDKPADSPEQLAWLAKKWQQTRSGTGTMAFRPAHGTWTMLMSWMQAIRFTEPVNTQARVARGDRLIAFRTRPMDRATHRFGRFYVRPDARSDRPPRSTGLGIAADQNVATWYEARRDFTCLETSAGDTFLSWTQTDQSYAHGWKRQLFICRPEEVLLPLF